MVGPTGYERTIARHHSGGLAVIYSSATASGSKTQNMKSFEDWAMGANLMIQRYAVVAKCEIVVSIEAKSARWACGAHWCSAALSVPDAKFAAIEFWDKRNWVVALIADPSTAGGRIAGCLLEKDRVAATP
jgi:hypothetical protein